MNRTHRHQTTELPQRRLALELRYAIDVERKKPTNASFQRVRSIIEAHPRGVTSRHVEHNLGVARMEWLRRNNLL